MKTDNVEISRPVLAELVECLEEAQRWHVEEDDAFEHRITLALDDYKTATWEPVKAETVKCDCCGKQAPKATVDLSLGAPWCQECSSGVAAGL